MDPVAVAVNSTAELVQEVVAQPETLRSLLPIAAFTAACLYFAGLSIYRLYFHPLAEYPGPRLAAITLGYEVWYDFFKGGKYFIEIKKMHRQYGPIVRISPNELHVNEPAFIDELYAAGGKTRDKSEYALGGFGLPDSAFATVSHNMHRKRRGALNPFFSKGAIVKLEPVIADAVDKLCVQLNKHEGTNFAIDMGLAFSCVTTDVVTEYLFANNTNFLDSPTFEQDFHQAVLAATMMSAVIKPIPWFKTMIQSLPNKWVAAMAPGMGSFLDWSEGLLKQVQDIERDIKHGQKLTSGRQHKTIFHELFLGDLPESEKNAKRLWEEGQVIMAAGTETTALILANTMYYILHDRAILAKLQAEMRTVMPDPSKLPSWKDLENSPYINAVIHEALRLSFGVSTRLPRIDPTGPLMFKSKIAVGGYGSVRDVSYAIPAGTAVGMSAALVHTNPDIFPEPMAFRPERWLDAAGQREKKLDKYLLSFSKGSRACIGINLALAEIYITLAAIVRRFEDRLQLFETDHTDVELYHDFTIPFPRSSSKGVRLQVTPPQGQTIAASA